MLTEEIERLIAKNVVGYFEVLDPETMETISLPTKTYGHDHAAAAIAKRLEVKRLAIVSANGWATIDGIRIEPSAGLVGDQLVEVTVRRTKDES